MTTCCILNTVTEKEDFDVYIFDDSETSFFPLMVSAKSVRRFMETSPLQSMKLESDGPK